MVAELMGHRNVQTTVRYFHTKNADALQGRTNSGGNPGGAGSAPGKKGTADGLRVWQNEVADLITEIPGLTCGTEERGISDRQVTKCRITTLFCAA
jgi:hypothetical protein